MPALYSSLYKAGIKRTGRARKRIRFLHSGKELNLPSILKPVFWLSAYYPFSSFLYKSYIPGVSVVDAACMTDNSPHSFYSLSGLHVQIHADAGCRLNLLFTFRGNETGHVSMGEGYEILHIPASEEFQSLVAGKQQFQRFTSFPHNEKRHGHISCHFFQCEPQLRSFLGIHM